MVDYIVHSHKFLAILYADPFVMWHFCCFQGKIGSTGLQLKPWAVLVLGFGKINVAEIVRVPPSDASGLPVPPLPPSLVLTLPQEA